MLIGGTLLPSAPNITLRNDGAAFLEKSIRVYAQTAVSDNFAWTLHREDNDYLLLRHGRSDSNPMPVVGTEFWQASTGKNAKPILRFTKDTNSIAIGNTLSGNGGGVPKIELNQSGSATFAGDIEAENIALGGMPVAGLGTAPGAKLRGSGDLAIAGEGEAIQIFNVPDGETPSNANETFRLRNDGTVYIGGMITSVPNIKLNASGQCSLVLYMQNGNQELLVVLLLSWKVLPIIQHKSSPTAAPSLLVT